MIQRSQCAGFAFEARQPLDIGRKRLGQNLQRDFTLQACVTRAIDLAHPAGANGLLDFIDANSRTGLKGHAAGSKR